MRQKFAILFGAFVFGAYCVLAANVPIARAVDYFWLGGDGLFADDNKWQDYGNPSHHDTPSANDSAVLYTNNTPYTVTFDDDLSVNYSAISGTEGSVYFNPIAGSYTANELRVGDYDGNGNPNAADDTTLLIYGDPLLPHDNLLTDFLTVGGGATGTLWLYGGAHYKSTQNDVGYGITTLGYSLAGVGTIYVADAGSLFDAAGNDVSVGKFGQGTLALYTGGQVTGVHLLSIGTEAGNTKDNSVNVNDSGSTLEADTIYVGDFGKGKLTVHSGGAVHLIDDHLFIGRVSGASGVVDVAGANSTLDAADRAIYVGSFGTGTMYVHDGAHATANYLFIGGFSSSQNNEVSVYDANSLLEANQVYVGYEGGASLSINSGGKLQVGVALYIGYLNTGVGDVSVTGAGSKLDALNNDIYVGWNGTGSLSVSAGGQVLNANIVGVGGGTNPHDNSLLVTGAGSSLTSIGLSVGFSNNPLADSTVTVADGAHIYVANSMTLGRRATLNVASGAVDVSDATPSATIGLRVGLNGTLTGAGKVVGNVVNTDAGRIIPGSALGTLTIEGNYTQSTGQLIFNLNGPNPSQYSHLSITGSAMFGGALNVQTQFGFAPALGNSFSLMTFASSSGTFNTVTLPPLASGLVWNTSQLYTAGTISVVSAAPITGDYNHNGIVDAADYTIWRDTLGRTGAGLAADGNSNNQVDPGDYTVWKNHFGETAGSGASAGVERPAMAAIPEPTTILIVLCALVGNLAIHWRPQ